MNEKPVSDTRNVLITGANGFLGSEIVRQAGNSGTRLRATDRLQAGVPGGVEYIQADILEPASLAPLVRGMDAVIHAAGLAHIYDRSPAAADAFHAVNEIGTANMARAAADAGVRHFVLVSSVSVYGASSAGIGETAACRPESPYAKSKWEAEKRAAEIAHEAKMKLTVLRLATLYGEEDPGNVGRLIRSIDRGRFLMIGRGLNRKSLMHREDAARACLVALQGPDQHVNIYNVSAMPHPMSYVVMELALSLGRKVPRWNVPASVALCVSEAVSKLARGKGPLGGIQTVVEKWLSDDVYDISKFQSRYHFEPGIALSDGLRREVQWYKSRSRAR